MVSMFIQSKTILLIVALFLMSASPLKEGTIKFSNLADMPTARGAITSVDDGKNIYVINGFSSMSKYNGLIEKYDVDNNRWSLFDSILTPTQFPSAAVIGNDLYVFNGDRSNRTLNDRMEVINLSTGEINVSVNNPEPAHAAGAAVWDGSIYSFGGLISNSKPVYSDHLHRFDPTTQKWMQLSSMPEAKEVKGVVVDGKLYVVGGYSGKVSNRIDVYDIKSDKWSKLLEMPFGISANTVVAHGLKIYTVFDYTNQSLIGCYDIASNSFTVLKQKDMVSRRHAGARIFHNKLYIVGGNTSSAQNSCLASLQVAELE